MRRAFFIAAFLFVAAGARAHSVDAPKSDAVRVEPGSISVTLEYLVSTSDAAELRRLYDVNRDGKLSARERDGLTRWVVLAASHFLQVTLDGKTLPMKEDTEVRVIDGIEDASGEIQARLVLRAAVDVHGLHSLAVTDRHKDPEIPVPVRVALVGGVEAATRADAGAGARADAHPDLRAVLDRQRATLAVDFRAP